LAYVCGHDGLDECPGGVLSLLPAGAQVVGERQVGGKTVSVRTQPPPLRFNLEEIGGGRAYLPPSVRQAEQVREPAPTPATEKRVARRRMRLAPQAVHLRVLRERGRQVGQVESQ
jgi:hypothetical protein